MVDLNALAARTADYLNQDKDIKNEIAILEENLHNLKNELVKNANNGKQEELTKEIAKIEQEIDEKMSQIKL
jgi:hypothetical protein